jgi:catechol 2,3-dioxygenase-like lactoylglutathione lyase family enzyme
MELSYVSVVTERLDELKDFYCEALGLPEYTDWSHEGFRALQAAPGVVLAFHTPAALGELGLDPGEAGSAPPMLTFDPGGAEELRQVHDRLVARSVPVLREPFSTPYGSLQSIYRDTDGNVFRLNSFAS